MAVLTELKDIYNDNIAWLNFAEVKNGALLTLTGIILTTFYNLSNCIWLKSIFVSLCIFIILINVCSFIPFLNNNILVKKLAKKYYQWCKFKSTNKQNNIIFYVSVFLSDNDTNEYENVILHFFNANNLSPIQKNYIEQIKQISIIASIKYFFFTIAVLNFLFMCPFLFFIILLS